VRSDSDSASPSRGAGRDRVAVAVAFAAIALGGLVLVGSLSIESGAGYDRIGPRFFPYLVAAGLLLSGGVLAARALRRESSLARELRDASSASALGILGVALVTSVLLLERAGFILTSTLLFWLVARAFESQRRVRDAVVGFVLSVFVYLAFTRGLGLDLPRGLLDGLF
jgi:putative tricarboxylic transport membrane protein